MVIRGLTRKSQDPCSTRDRQRAGMLRASECDFVDCGQGARMWRPGGTWATGGINGDRTSWATASFGSRSRRARRAGSWRGALHVGLERRPAASNHQPDGHDNATDRHDDKVCQHCASTSQVLQPAPWESLGWADERQLKPPTSCRWWCQQKKSDGRPSRCRQGHLGQSQSQCKKGVQAAGRERGEGAAM